MASKYWIKLYHQMLDDPKIGRLSDSQFRLAVNLFLLAGDCDRGGILPPLADIRWRLRDPANFDADLDALLACEILEENDGVLLVSKFTERQGAISTEERSRRRRDRDRKTDYYQPEPDAKRARTAHDSCADVDIDEEKDAGKDKKTDADADADADKKKAAGRKNGSSVSPTDELVRCFVDHTGIPINTGGRDKWALALSRLKSAAITPDDLRAALSECQAKNLVIASLGSIVNPAIIAKSRRSASARASPSSGEDYRRYLKGQYGDFGLS